MINSIIKEDMEDIYSRRKDWSVLNNKTVLLTGAYGMLASYITYFLYYLKNEKNIKVNLIAVVRSEEKFYKKFKNLKNIEQIHLVESDLKDILQVEENVDYIIHAASLASPQFYNVCPVDVLEPNTIGNYNLLNFAKDKSVKSYLLFSTGDVYGKLNTATGLIDEHVFGSLDTLDIHNCYSESKRMAETMCKAFYVQYNVPTKIARIAHTYAPTMDIENDPRVFASFVKNIVNHENIIMKSDGTGKRAFCYISDAVAGYFSILLDGENGEAYNVCNREQFISVRELADILAGLYPERNIEVVRKERCANENYTENSLLVGSESTLNDSKLKKLGWETRIDVRTGFDRVIRYIENESTK